MPRWRDWEDLSREAVERSVDRVFTRDVFPLSTWPKTPTFRFRIRLGSIDFRVLAETVCAIFYCVSSYVGQVIQSTVLLKSMVMKAGGGEQVDSDAFEAQQMVSDILW